MSAQSRQISTLLPPNWPQLAIADIAQLAPVQELTWPAVNQLGVSVYCKREELLHPLLSGNKFYKLHGYIAPFRRSGSRAIASFGGAYSNHLYSLAALGQQLGIETIGIVRGDDNTPLSPTLKDAQDMGMRLMFVSREQYRMRDQQRWLAELKRNLGDVFLVAEGGGGLEGALGCVAWGRQTLAKCAQRPTVACVAAGTGTTAAGLSVGLGDIPLHVFLALRGRDTELLAFKDNILALRRQILAEQSLESCDLPSICLESNYHCGGYAKFPSPLRAFVEQFEAETGMALDPVYTAKLFWGIWQKVLAGQWCKGQQILVFHSGGLQGRRGLVPALSADVPPRGRSS